MIKKHCSELLFFILGLKFPNGVNVRDITQKLPLHDTVSAQMTSALPVIVCPAKNTPFRLSKIM